VYGIWPHPVIEPSELFVIFEWAVDDEVVC